MGGEMGDDGKPEIAKPHDSLVRNVLADTELAADFLRTYLPPDLEAKLEWSSLRQESGETVAQNFTRRIGDLRYSARFKGGGAELDVCVMVEHQSRPDSLMSFRMMEYICAAYRQRVSAFRKGTRFPYPLAVVLHHGKTPWKKIAPMRDLITIPQGLEKDILNFPIHLIDLAVMPVEELRGHPMVCALLDILQSASAGALPNRDQQIFARLHDISSKQDVLPWIEALLKYYYAVFPGEPKNIHDNTTRLLTRVYGEKEAGKMATTMLEVIQREGMAKGQMEGMVKGQIKSVMTVLKTRFGEIPPTLRNKLLKVRSDEHIETLLKQATTCQSLKEFQKAL
jgi:predicted transposase YdaD